MAEPAYPSLEDDEPKIGFEGLNEETAREKVDDKRLKKDTEEIGLIEIDKVFFRKSTQ